MKWAAGECEYEPTLGSFYTTARITMRLATAICGPPIWCRIKRKCRAAQRIKGVVHLAANTSDESLSILGLGATLTPICSVGAGGAETGLVWRLAARYAGYAGYAAKVKLH